MKLKGNLASVLLLFCLVFVSRCFGQDYSPEVMVDEYEICEYEFYKYEIYTFIIPLGKYDTIDSVAF